MEGSQGSRAYMAVIWAVFTYFEKYPFGSLLDTVFVVPELNEKCKATMFDSIPRKNRRPCSPCKSIGFRV